MNDLIGRAVSGKNRSPAKTRMYHGMRVIEQKQTIDAGASSEIRDNRQTQSVTVLTALPKFVFDLKVFKAGYGPDPQGSIWEPLDYPLRLEAGYQYRIEASTSLNESYSPNGDQDMKQWPVAVPFAMDVYLQPNKVIPALTFSNAIGTVMPGEETEKFHHDFLLSVGTECPSDLLMLELLYKENAIEKRATRLPIELIGSYNEADRQLWEKVGIDESIQPPDSMALLHVEAVEQGKLRISCWNRRPLPNRPVFLKPIEQPELGLDFLEQNINDPQAIQNTIDNISDFFALRIPQLSTWLSCILQKYHEQSCIVIVDETASNVPWEMLEVEEGKYLGAQAAVVRWTEAQYRSLRAMLRLQDNEKHVGTVLAYVHFTDQIHTTQECPILAHLAPTIYTSEDTLKPHLSDEELPLIGLVYLRYRGSFRYGNEPREVLQLLNNPYGEPVQIRFAGIEDKTGKRPVVFVNACHSARILWDDSDSFGLVKILLAKFAAGYIGTIGPVEPGHAAWIAQGILQNSSSFTDGIRLTEQLRRLRHEAVERYIHDPETPANKMTLIYTFMYIYYGNPYARLRLVDTRFGETRQEQEDD